MAATHSAQRPPAAPAPGTVEQTASQTPGGPKPLPKGPKGRFLSGHLQELGRDQLGCLSRWARDYGDFVPVRFGPARAVLISDPQTIESVLVTNHRNFVKTPALRVSRQLLGNGLVTSEGDFWRRQRQLMQPAFHRQRIAAYAETMVAEAERMLETWQDGETRDVALDMTAVTMAIVTKTLFGADVGDQAAQVVGPALRIVGEHFNSRLYSLLFLIPDSLPTPGNLRLRRAVHRVDEIIFRMIDRQRERHLRGEESNNLLSMLLDAQNEADGARMTLQQLRDEVMTLFLAGHDTTALALSWTWFLLSQRPGAERALQAELQTVLGNRPPTMADLPQLKYTGMVITEAMRLYPPAWSVGRQAITDCQIGGYSVRKGTIVFMSQWVVHRDPRYFDDPDAFLPERWDPAEDGGLAKRLPKYAYFPFGGGPRVCIGNSFATMEATLLLATIAQRFRLALAPGHIVVPQTYLTLRPKYGMKMTLHHRA